jgi:hypothetical protein
VSRPGATLRVPLHEIAHGRAGDKGNRCNISVIAFDRSAYPTLLEQVTPERVRAFFAHRGATGVTRYELPRLGALNLVIDDVLEGGVTDLASGALLVVYLGRAALSSMDVPARQSFTMAVVDPAERTAAAGVTSLARGAAQACGPVLASVALVPLGLSAPLIACAVLKIAYDVALFGAFRATRTPAV